MQRKWFFALILIIGTATLASAQGIAVKEERPVTEMMERFTQLNRSVSTINGYRVQILATPDRQQLESARQVFQYKYPNIRVDWVHTNPWYKLYVGAFDNKLEAMRLQYLLKRDYPNAYLVRDNTIRPVELVGSF
ncbi:MAG: SPOR domain-containing protein [Saprospiraceae bacterium]